MRMRLVFTGLLLTFPAVAGASVMDTSYWINEFHYDNVSTDSGEFVEVVVPASTSNLADFSVTLYNGSNGTAYGTTALSSFTAGATVGDFKIYSFTFPADGVQNGSPDGIAFFNTATSTVYQFLSYEGEFAAVGGAANGLSSTDVGVTEGSATPVGSSLYLTGSGDSYGDFIWAGPATATKGAINTDQAFTSIPEPASVGLLSLGVAALLAKRTRRAVKN